MPPLIIGRTNDGVFSSRSSASGVHSNSHGGADEAAVLDPRPIWATTAEKGQPPDFFSEAAALAVVAAAGCSL